MSSPHLDSLLRIAFVLSAAGLGVGYGYFAHHREWFPHNLVATAQPAFQKAAELVRGERPWYYVAPRADTRTTRFRPDAAQPGPTLVAFMGPERRQLVQVVAPDGTVLNEWRVNWFDLWPDANHLPADLRPKSLPGPIIHGLLLLDDGGIVFNHEASGLVRLDACGHVVWRLRERTHHSLHLDERGHLWTSIRHRRDRPHPSIPFYHPPWDDYSIAEISPDGRLLREVSLTDLLVENNLIGLLMMRSKHPDHPDTGGDILHVNDVEVFPSTLKPGRFRPGDVMVSMRGNNAYVVFDLEKRAVRHVSVGGFVRQHDPDFLDGDTVSVFDNNHIGKRADGVFSRVMIENAATGQRRVAFSGTPELPVYTEFMGKHQWLPNGNLLVVESTSGRVLEVDRDGRPVWQFVALVEPGWAGAVSEGTRVPEKFTAEFFAAARAACRHPKAAP